MPKSKPRDRTRNRIKPKPIKWKSDAAMMRVPTNPRPTVEFPRPELNSKMEFTLVPHFLSSSPKSKVERSRLGGRSVYQVTYFLSIPGVDLFLTSVDAEKLFKYGTSLLQLPPEELLILDMESGDKTDKTQIHFLPNKDQLLSHIKLRVECDSFEDAERYAHERVATVLSYWSFLYDVGLEIGRYEIIEEATGSKKLSFGVVGKVKPFNNDLPFALASNEYRRILAAYREATTSSNLFYQALSLFKVVEGTLNLRKKRKSANENWDERR